MLWMGIWVHPYTVALVQVELDFRENGYGWAQVILLDHGWGSKPTWSAFHIHIICIQSVLAPWNVVDGHMGQPLYCYACAGGVGFQEKWVWLSLSDVAILWLRLQTHMECIPHPYYMYTKCFITWICCGWGYGSTLTLLLLRQVELEFSKIGYGWAQEML